MTRWKATERRIAAEVGGRRVPVSGRVRGDQPDIEHPLLSIEVKDRASLPGWLKDALAQARAAARDGRAPVVILHEKGQRHAGDLVLVGLEDFIRLTDANRERSEHR